MIRVMPSTDSQRDNARGNYARFVGLGFTLILIFGLPTVVGFFLDRLAGTLPLFLLVGLAVGFVGASFPIVLAMVEQMPDHGSIRPYIALAYAFGHLGQMISPLHLCQVVSNEYFGAESRAVYRRLLVPAVLTGAVAIGYFWLLKALLG